MKEGTPTKVTVEKQQLMEDTDNWLHLHYWVSPTRTPHFYLVFTTCAILGNVTRTGILKLSNYEHSFIAPQNTLWPNFVSCMIMGMFQIFNTAENAWFADYPYLFSGITTGFCGCLSSYSSMMLEVFLYSASLNKVNISQHVTLPNRAYGIMEFLSVLLSQMFVSLGAYLFGRSLATDIIVKYIDRHVENEEMKENEVESVRHPVLRKYVRFFDLLLAGLAVPLIALFVVLAAVYNNYSRSNWTLGPIFGIVGAFSRYYISTYVNPLNVRFYLGTFTCNQIAVLLLSFFTMIERGYNSSMTAPIAKTVNACRIVSALGSGYCGSLSTISTFINESYNLKLHYALFYNVMTYAISYMLLVVTLGAFSWSRGLTEPMC
ncbi:fluoride export protein 1 [Monosporozyma unispora]|nr:hypothetical protein C6P44_001581 [Kazachstania unispora]